MADISENAKLTIRELYCKCEQSFEEMAGVLRSEDCLITRFKILKPSEMMDLQTRLLSWGKEYKANLPATTRGSLEHRLRYDVDEVFRESIEKTLGYLSSHLSELTLMGQREYDPVDFGSYDDFARIVKDVDEVSDIEDYESDTEDMSEEAECGLQFVLHVRGLGDLMKLGVQTLITVTNAVDIGQRQAERAKEELEWEPELGGVVEMARQWRASANVDQNINLTEEATASNSVDDIMWFCERLALANARRRKDIQDPNHILNRPSDMNNIGDSFPDDSTDSNVLALKHFEMLSRQWENSLECKTIRVSPWVCTFQNCNSPCTLYEGSALWTHHEQTRHRFQYICSKCKEFTTTNSEKIKSHLLFGKHTPPIEQKNMELYLRHSFRQGQMYQDKKDTCLICLTEHSLPDLYDHLSEHMKHIARLVLPSSDTNTEALEALSLNDNSR